MQIEELKRYTQNKLPDTVRKIVSVLFGNSVLAHYSFVGQKKKKMFKELKSCSLVFGEKKCIIKSSTYCTNVNAIIVLFFNLAVVN